MEELEKKIANNKALAKGKSSKDCSFDEAVAVYRATVSKSETPKERLDRINAFRCGW